MPRRFLGTLVVVCALALVCAGSAAAASLTFDGRVLRYRADPRVDASVSVYGGRFRPEQLEVSVRVPEPDVGFGCDKDLEESDGLPERVAFVCPILVPFEQVRYRFVLSDRADGASGSGNGLRGVVYAGNGGDGVHEGDRVYGGRGDDSLDGAQLYGGPGDDSLYGILVRESLAGDARAAGRNVLYGGRGNDKLQAPGWLYGGPAMTTSRTPDWRLST